MTRFNRQVLVEHLRGNARVFVLTGLVIALTFALYGLYGGVTRIYGMPIENASTAQLTLPADAIVYEPAWLLLTASPNHDLRDVGRIPAVASDEGSAITGQAVRVETPMGYRMVWGFDMRLVSHLTGVELVKGQWPSGEGTVAVPEGSGLDPGDHVTVQFLHPFTQETSRASLEVVGSYRADWSLELPWITPTSTTESLLGVVAHNIRFGYQVVQPDWAFRRRRVTVDLPGAYRETLDAWMTRIPVVPWPKDTTPPAWAQQLGGSPLFDTSLTGPVVISPASVTRAESTVQQRVGYALVPIMMTVLSVVLAILTLVVVNVFLGQQRTIGIWRALGVASGEIRILYFYTITVVGLAGTALGVLLYVPLLYLVGQLIGQPLPVPWSSAVLWVVVLLGLGAWGAHVAGALFTASSIRSYLDNETTIDWWALIRFGAD